jgi:trehalose-6-phosphatase
MIREFVGGPMDGTKIPLGDDDLTDEIHIDMVNLNGSITVHIYVEEEETGNYKYEGESSPNDLYEEEEDEDE